MQQKKSKGIFWIFSILAVIFLTLFSFALGATNVPMMILTFILHCIDFIRSTQRQLLNVIVLLIRTCTFKSNIIKVLDTI